jgi:hypothetical protein
VSVDLAPAFVQVDLDPVAVVLDFAEPLIPDRCLGFQGGELGLDDPGISDGRAPSIISASRRLGVRFATTQLTKSPPAGGQRRVVSTEYFLRFPSARPAWSFQTREHARVERRSVRSHPARRYATRSIASAPTEARLTAIKVQELFSHFNWAGENLAFRRRH